MTIGFAWEAWIGGLARRADRPSEVALSSLSDCSFPPHERLAAAMAAHSPMVIVRCSVIGKTPPGGRSVSRLGDPGRIVETRRCERLRACASDAPLRLRAAFFYAALQGSEPCRACPALFDDPRGSRPTGRGLLPKVGRSWDELGTGCHVWRMASCRIRHAYYSLALLRWSC